jgi:hypothetical protein
VAERSTAGSGFFVICTVVVVVVGETVGELVQATRTRARTTIARARNLTVAMLP